MIVPLGQDLWATSSPMWGPQDNRGYVAFLLLPLLGVPQTAGVMWLFLPLFTRARPSPTPLPHKALWPPDSADQPGLDLLSQEYCVFPTTHSSPTARAL